MLWARLCRAPRPPPARRSEETALRRRFPQREARCPVSERTALLSATGCQPGKHFLPRFPAGLSAWGRGSLRTGHPRSRSRCPRGGVGWVKDDALPPPLSAGGSWLSLPSCVGFFSPSLALDESLMIWGSEHSLTRNQPTLNRDNVILK